jgi:hypothetical protein
MHSVTSNAVSEALSTCVKKVGVTIHNVVIDGNGVLNIEQYIPSGINLLFASFWNWGSASLDNNINVSGDGRYLRGTPNNTINWVVIAYFYIE